MKLVRYSKDVYQILDDGCVVAFLALRLANGKWGAYDSNDGRLTKQAFETPKDVLSYIAGRAALEKETRE